MTPDESRRAIIEALGLSPHHGRNLIEALDARYANRHDVERDVSKLLAGRPGGAQTPLGSIVAWGGDPRRVGRCSDGGQRCLSCERRGWHLEPVEAPEPLDENGRNKCRVYERMTARAKIVEAAMAWWLRAEPIVLDLEPLAAACKELSEWEARSVEHLTRPVVEHCLGNDCECLCPKCAPPVGGP